MRRALLVTVTLAAAIAGPWALWEPPPARTLPQGPDRPDRVLMASHQGYLPFGCAETSSCCKDGLQVALLVATDALWVGSTAGANVRVPRDGHEWQVLGPLLRERVGNRRGVEIAVQDDAQYEDLLVAMMVARSAGIYPSVVQPALPVYPHHGRGGGLPERY